MRGGHLQPEVGREQERGSSWDEVRLSGSRHTKSWAGMDEKQKREWEQNLQGEGEPLSAICCLGNGRHSLPGMQKRSLSSSLSGLHCGSVRLHDRKGHQG